MTSASARVAISSHWLRNSTAPTTCRICWSASPNRHRICTPPSMYHFLLVGNPFQNRCTDICKFQVILSCTIILFAGARNKHRTRQEECKELHFENKGRPYFAIGFPNMAGGYEVRNRYFKGCVAQRTSPISDKVENSRQPVIFRGLHGLPLVPFHPCEEQSAMPRLTTQDYIILNSVSNLAKAEGILADYSQSAVSPTIRQDGQPVSICKQGSGNAFRQVHTL